ncbi:MAG: nucleoside triphosphate pyrophosphohydrolase [Anaerolineales bacterium]|nr:nucleoside triphosphate pyrophosphohydrolase [Anaerolineales bacterium]MCX7755553.1 nucleoside triphosphate pyrophosphohydrolase [Anaerolineales bacterium]MDW8278408.1 nucleoside triphosphate pyrophosphohydrolase [Anaerolineales bacterium]
MLSAEHFALLSRLLDVDSLPSLSMVHAKAFTTRHVPPSPADMPLLVTSIESGALLKQVCGVLRAVYPLEHPARLICLPTSHVTAQTLGALLSQDGFVTEGLPYALYLSPLPVGSSFETFQEIIAHLRAPDGCPWDRKQTHQTLRKYLLEESYETLAAMDANDPVKMREEFGDLLLQIVLNAQIGYEAGTFNMTEVFKEIHDKLVRRHPHVFGQVQVDGVGQVLANWESIKQEERRTRGEEEKSLLDGLPAALPALSQAQEYQSRAARVGFDWPEIEGVLEKIREEIEEIRRSATLAELTTELGDLLFALVNLARWKKVDAEAALRETNQKFRNRFGYIEKRAREMGRDLKEMSLQEMDALWDEAKNAMR